MNILLLGKTGQLGWELHRTLAPLGKVWAVDYPEIDLSQPESIRPLVKEAQPQLIVNATAYTAVDNAESEHDIAMAVNGLAPGILAEEASALKAALIHYSTDYVFDGAKGKAYVETDSPNPLNVYGQSKLAGEQAILAVNENSMILRTSWVYSLHRASFVTKMLSWSRSHTTLRIVDDQVGNPTWARMLAEISAQLLAMGRENIVDWVHQYRGVYHLAGSGSSSRYQWAKAILQHDPNKNEQVTLDIQPASTAEFPTPATRPLYSALDCARFTTLFGLQLPPWEEALQLAIVSA
jgi:dTDP-4-dehydrorhamnose reductase